MNFKKIIFVISLMAIFLPSYAGAQNVGDLVTIDEEIEGNPNNPPEDSIITLYVDQLELKKRYFEKGEVVSGSFKIINNSSTKDRQNLYYEVSLVGNYDGLLPEVFYDSQKMDGQIINIDPNQTINLDFNYKLPGNIGGNGLGIWVELFSEDGYSLGWVDKKISIGGESDLDLSVEDFRLIVDDIPYESIEGPTIRPDREGIFSILYVSEDEKEFNVELSIRKLEDQEIVFEEVYTGVKSNSDGIRFEKELLVFDYVGGVYVGTIKTSDSDGNKLTPNINFQYLVAGEDSLNIREAILENLEYDGKNLSGSILVSVSEPTYDLVTGDLNGDSSGILIVNYKNINGETIKTDSIIVDSINQREYIFNYLLEGTDYATAEIKLHDSEGNIVFDQKNITIKKPDEIKGLSIITIIILIVTVGVVIGYLIYKMKKNDSNTGPVLAVLIVMIFSFFFVENTTMAAMGYWSDNQCRSETGQLLTGGQQCRNAANTAKSSKNHSNAIPQALQFNPARNEFGDTEFSPGQEIFISGSTYVEACQNGVPGMYYYGRKSWTVEDGGYATGLTFEKFHEQEYSRNYNSTGVDYGDGNAYKDWNLERRGHWFKRTYQFAFSAGNAPVKSGNYTIDVLVRNCIYAGGSVNDEGEIILNGSYHTACGHKTVQVPITVKEEIIIEDQCTNDDLHPGIQDYVPEGYTQVFVPPDGKPECHIDEFSLACYVDGGPRFGAGSSSLNPPKVPARNVSGFTDIDFLALINVDEASPIVTALAPDYSISANWSGVVTDATTTDKDMNYSIPYRVQLSDLWKTLSSTITAVSSNGKTITDTCSVDVVECLIDSDCVYDPAKPKCNTRTNTCVPVADLVVSCEATPDFVDKTFGNSSVNWRATLSAGAGSPPYTYNWSGTFGAREETTNNLSVNRTEIINSNLSSGQKYMRVRVEDSLGEQSNTASCNIYVIPCEPGQRFDEDAGLCLSEIPDITVDLNPKIVNKGKQCFMTVTATNSSSCYLYPDTPNLNDFDLTKVYDVGSLPFNNESAIHTFLFDPTAGDNGMVFGDLYVDPGSYVLYCQDRGNNDDGGVYNYFYQNPIVCSQNLDVKEI